MSAEMDKAEDAYWNAVRKLPFGDVSLAAAFRAGWMSAVGPFTAKTSRKLCENCQGTGKIYDEPKKWIVCPVCGGSGYVDTVPLQLTPDGIQQAVLAGIDRILRVPFLSDEDRKILTAQKILWGKGGGTTADLLQIYNTL